MQGEEMNQNQKMQKGTYEWGVEVKNENENDE